MGIFHLAEPFRTGEEIQDGQTKITRKGNHADSRKGGITNGNDMVAAYLRQSKVFPRPVVELACSMADVGDRGEKYSV